MKVLWKIATFITLPLLFRLQNNPLTAVQSSGENNPNIIGLTYSSSLQHFIKVSNLKFGSLFSKTFYTVYSPCSDVRIHNCKVINIFKRIFMSVVPTHCQCCSRCCLHCCCCHPPQFSRWRLWDIQALKRLMNKV